MDLRNIEKKVKFNNKYWLVRMEDINFPPIKVYTYDINDNLETEPIYEGYAGGDTLIEMFKNVVLKANKICVGSNEYENIINWDGDMDKELRK